MPEHNESLILIVDDNPKNLQVLGNMLREAQYKTVVAKDGAKAIEIAQKKTPDLILLDVMMPEMDGFETCRRLKADDATQAIPVIFITALTSPDDKLKGFEAGGVDYITKPFNTQEVLARVQVHAQLRRAQQELQRLNEQLQAANASKDKFFAIIAHDLRGPLGALHNLTQFVVKHIEVYSPEKILQMLTMYQDATHNLLVLMENLLTWSKLQRGMIEYHPEVVAVEGFVARNITLLTPNAEQKQITLTRAIAQKTVVYADPNMIDTVIRNLLSNALKFTEAGGTVTVSATCSETVTAITVADTGIGIRAESLPKLFRIDVQRKNIGTAGEVGSGLGLILCKEFVEKNGGTIRVESMVGQGSRFTFTLPNTNL